MKVQQKVKKMVWMPAWVHPIPGILSVSVRIMEFRLCYYSMESLFIKQKFMTELRTTFGFGGLNCSFSDQDLSDFHNYLEKDFQYSDPGKTKCGVRSVGRQMNGEADEGGNTAKYVDTEHRSSHR